MHHAANQMVKQNNKSNLTLPRSHQASATSCSTPVLLSEWSCKKRDSSAHPSRLCVIILHTLFSDIHAEFVAACFIPYLVGTVSRVDLLEVSQRLHYCWRALHIGVIYHDVTWWCVRGRGRKITMTTFHQHNKHPLFNILFHTPRWSTLNFGI